MKSILIEDVLMMAKKTQNEAEIFVLEKDYNALKKIHTELLDILESGEPQMPGQFVSSRFNKDRLIDHDELGGKRQLKEMEQLDIFVSKQDYDILKETYTKLLHNLTSKYDTILKVPRMFGGDFQKMNPVEDVLNMMGCLNNVRQ